MFDFHEKRKIRQLVYSKFFIGALFLIGIFIAQSAYERYIVEIETAEKRAEKMQEFEELQNRAALLEAKIDHLENERGLEEEIRNRFDVVKEGEQVVVILENASENSNIPSPSELTVPPGEESFRDEREKDKLLEFLQFWR